MTATIHITEGVPDEYPDAPDGLSTAAAALDPEMIWQRIEAYIAHRYSERSVQWIAEGPGCWEPTLKPATITTVEVWRGEAWETTSLGTSPLGGYMLPGVGPYRFIGTAGDDDADVPALVTEAYRRLAEYLAVKPGKPGVRSESVQAGTISLSTTRSLTATAEAMQNSGAADVLRTFRRV